jgi:putative ABC transport system substrate-binding protein
MTGVGDPVGVGLVTSLARPGGNITGVVSLVPEHLLPSSCSCCTTRAGAKRIAVLINPDNPCTRA